MKKKIKFLAKSFNSDYPSMLHGNGENLVVRKHSNGLQKANIETDLMLPVS